MPEPTLLTDALPAPPAGCLPVASPEARELLAGVRMVYTDLDGTLLAPGGRLLVAHDGTPQVATAAALVALKTAGIDVALITGRGADQGSEFLRLLNLDCYIGEVGGYLLRRTDVARAEEHYMIGAWEHTVLSPGLAPGVLPADTNPFELIGRSGIIERLANAFPGMLFTYPATRSVSWSLWGHIDVKAAQNLLDREALPLQLLDNGILYHTPAPLPGDATPHIYHLLPAGVTKMTAIAADQQFRALAPAATLAIGDSAVDLQMGEATGVFVMMANGLRNPAVQEAVAARIAAGAPVLHTTRPTTDGWVEFADALLAARSA